VGLFWGVIHSVRLKMEERQPIEKCWKKSHGRALESSPTSHGGRALRLQQWFDGVVALEGET
jgi:hypothetical protein